MAAIVAADILFRLSAPTATAGNQLAQANPNASLGNYVSTTQLSGTALNNLFDDVTGAENTAGTTDYRCLFVHNSNTANALQNAVVYLQGGDPAGGSTVTIAVDTTAPSALAATGFQALPAGAAGTETAPGAAIVGLTYAAPTTVAAGLALGTIGIGQVKAFWVRRATSGAAAVNAETVTFAVTGDTGAA